MKKLNLKALGMGAVLLATTALSTSAFAGGLKYEVSITNLTKGIQFTPIMVAAHKDKVRLFELGSPASEELGRVAEGGDTSGIAAMFDGYHDQVQSSAGLLNGGETATLTFDDLSHKARFTIASMLLPTNDAFVAGQSLSLKRKQRTQTFYLRTYDAGTETNSETCSTIPGPLCGGEPFSPNDEGEGYVYIHSGIHGIGDLSASAYTWNDPVLKVTITRMR
ncbi:MAG: spondin domain-containing protein [Kangiellaceae bacterium]